MHDVIYILVFILDLVIIIPPKTITKAYITLRSLRSPLCPLRLKNDYKP